MFACFASLVIIGCKPSAPKAGSGDLIGFEIIEIQGSSVKMAKRKDPSGQAVIEGFVEGEKKTGQWLEYDNNGDVSTIAHYVNGLLEGTSFKLSHRGQIDQRTNYHLGELDGTWVQYKFGKVMETRNYKNGKLDGSVKIYDDKTFKLRQETEYKNGLQDGIFRYYDDNGNVSMEYQYKNGEKVSGGIVK
jgi:antitoxin component YwqK of YwqJK toxin-antitoxin module